jgi:hypothetical protein
MQDPVLLVAISVQFFPEPDLSSVQLLIKKIHMITLGQINHILLNVFAPENRVSSC